MFSVTKNWYVIKGARTCSCLVSMTIAHAVRGKHCGYHSLDYQNLVILKISTIPFCKDSPVTFNTFVLNINGDVLLPHLPPRH